MQEYVKWMDVQTVGDLRKLLDGIEDDTKVVNMDLLKESFIVLVDSNGNAKKLVTNKRSFLIGFDVEWQ